MYENKLYRPTAEISSEPPKSVEKVATSTVQKGLLLRAMVDGYSSNDTVAQQAGELATSYTTETDGTKHLKYQELSPSDMQELLEHFRKDPKKACATVRVNLIRITRDTSLSEEQRKDRLERYLKAFLEILPKLDRYAFPAGSPDTVLKGVPTYIPDGVSDMGGDPEVDPHARSREKIRVDKHLSYEKALSELQDALWALKDTPLDPSSDGVKIFLAKHVMATVYRSMPYDTKNQAILPRDRSIRVDEFVNAQEALSVCRHIAMETQLRLQALGLESRLLKCTMDGEPHVANVLRINGQWYLIDSTNPEIDPINPKQGKPYARPISLTDEPVQTWILDRYVRSPDGTTVMKKPITYQSRNNMYYRILDNENNPAQ